MGLGVYTDLCTMSMIVAMCKVVCECVRVAIVQCKLGILKLEGFFLTSGLQWHSK